VLSRLPQCFGCGSSPEFVIQDIVRHCLILSVCRVTHSGVSAVSHHLQYRPARYSHCYICTCVNDFCPLACLRMCVACSDHFEHIILQVVVQNCRSTSVYRPVNRLCNTGPFEETALQRPFYRAMHFSAKRGIAIACRLSVCLSVCL